MAAMPKNVIVDQAKALKKQKSAKFYQKVLHFYFFAVYLQSQMRELGVWRSWLAHLVWDQRVLCSSHSTPTKRQLSDGSCLFLYNFDLATWYL